MMDVFKGITPFKTSLDIVVVKKSIKIDSKVVGRREEREGSVVTGTHKVAGRFLPND